MNYASIVKSLSNHRPYLTCNLYLNGCRRIFYSISITGIGGQRMRGVIEIKPMIDGLFTVLNPLHGFVRHAVRERGSWINTVYG